MCAVVQPKRFSLQRAVRDDGNLTEERSLRKYFSDRIKKQSEEIKTTLETIQKEASEMGSQDGGSQMGSAMDSARSVAPPCAPSPATLSACSARQLARLTIESRVSSFSGPNAVSPKVSARRSSGTASAVRPMSRSTTPSLETP